MRLFFFFFFPSLLRNVKNKTENTVKILLTHLQLHEKTENEQKKVKKKRRERPF